MSPTTPKSRKSPVKKTRRPRAGKRQAATPRRTSHREMTASEVVREALLRG